MTITEKTVAFAPTASFRAMGEEGVILMTDTGQLYSTNDSGTAFLQKIAAGETVREAVDALLEEFEVEEAELVADLGELVAFLEAEGVVTTRDA